MYYTLEKPTWIALHNVFAIQKIIILDVNRICIGYIL